MPKSLCAKQTAFAHLKSDQQGLTLLFESRGSVVPTPRVDALF